MTPRDFCYWLQGYFELTKHNRVTPGQIECIKNHLNMVFHHVDKTFGDKDHQDKLADLHSGKITLEDLKSEVNC